MQNWQIDFRTLTSTQQNSVLSYLEHKFDRHFLGIVNFYGIINNELSLEIEPTADVETINFEKFKRITATEELLQKDYYIVTRKDMQTIYDIACGNWKTIIADYTKEHGETFTDKVNIPAEKVELMFKSATSTQLATLERIFPKFKSKKTIKGAFEDLTYLGCYFNTETLRGIKIVDNTTIKLVLPIANREWSLEAFELCTLICTNFKDAYPRHDEQDANKYLTIFVREV